MTPTHLSRHGHDPRTVVLVLPGGKVSSRRRLRLWHLSNLRMLPFAWLLRRRGVEAVLVRYRARGWNGAEQSPVTDAREVLDQITASDPEARVVLLGHSMGGRVAAALAGDPAVVGVVALAPWWPARPDFRMGSRVVVVHGTADRWTDPAASKAAVDYAVRGGVDATWIGIEGVGHFMVRRHRHWHRSAVDAVMGMVQALTEPKVGERR